MWYVQLRAGVSVRLVVCLIWLFFPATGSWSPVTDALLPFERTELWSGQMLSKETSPELILLCEAVGGNAVPKLQFGWRLG